MTPISSREMRAAGYADTLATGSIAAGGTPGILFPPSIILMIFGAVDAAICPDGPGRRGSPATGRPGVTLRNRVRALRGPWQFLTLFAVTIGGIYAEVFSPTEAASIGALGAVLLGLLGRRLRPRERWSAPSRARSSPA